MEYQTFFTRQFEISLPDTYIGGDPVKDRRDIKREIKELPLSEQPLFKHFFKTAFFSFMAADTHLLDGQMKPTTCTINMMKAPARYANLSAEELKQSMVSQMKSSPDVLEADTIKLIGLDAVRIFTFHYKQRGILGLNTGGRSHREDNEPPVEKSATFMFVHAGNFVSMIFTTEPQFFNDQLPLFEASAASLKIH